MEKNEDDDARMATLDPGGDYVGNNAEDVSIIHAMGLGVDDNDPALENIPNGESEESEVSENVQTWGWSGINNRLALGCVAIEPSMCGTGMDPMRKTDVFRWSFPSYYYCIQSLVEYEFTWG